MRYQNKHDYTGNCSKQGERAEDMFASLVFDLGGIATPSTIGEQFKGVDYHVDLSGTVDVKSLGNRKNKTLSLEEYNKVWIELKNVQGRKGWVYNEADFIAFERKTEFLVVKRRGLVDLIDNIVNLSDMVLHPSECMYNVYSRIGRKDLLTRVTETDIKTCEHYTLPKQ